MAHMKLLKWNSHKPTTVNLCLLSMEAVLHNQLVSKGRTDAFPQTKAYKRKYIF